MWIQQTSVRSHACGARHWSQGTPSISTVHRSRVPFQFEPIPSKERNGWQPKTVQSAQDPSLPPVHCSGCRSQPGPLLGAFGTPIAQEHHATSSFGRADVPRTSVMEPGRFNWPQVARIIDLIASMRDRRTTFKSLRSGDMIASHANRNALATASVSCSQRRSSSASCRRPGGVMV